jgi:hypothetical protein
MLGKLLRYEFKALLRVLPALYLAIQVLAVAAGINRLRTGGRYDGEGILKYLEISLGVMVIALFAVNLVVIILRFRDNLLKDEGYLMFTLPVTEWELIAAKAIAGFCSILLTALAGTLALLIYGFIFYSTQMLETLSEMAAKFSSDPVWPVFGVLFILVTIFQQLCLIYASITVSQRAPRFRGPAGVGVYLAVMISAYHITGLVFSHIGLVRDGIPYLAAGLFLQTALVALFFCCTGWLLKRTLNLE